MYNVVIISVEVSKGEVRYFVRHLYESMRGTCTNDDNSLICTVISRSDIDMVQIKEYFQKMYSRSLHSVIKVRQ